MEENALQFIGFLESQNKHSSYLAVVHDMSQEEIQAILTYLKETIEALKTSAYGIV